jgi:two-component system, NtrC family, response regulator HydG
MADRLLGNSPAIRDLHAELSFIAASDAKVLITGESGVGKEVVAHTLHAQSRRSSHKIVVVNCAGVPDTLLESELFGHVRGSFTDAHTDKRGLLEIAHGGTVFLDEIGEMSIRMQALLLRFLENGEIQRVGSERHHTTVDVRVISATNRDLASRIASKEFREDLYYRLNVIRLALPPLRDRPEDIPVLLDHFIRLQSEALGVAPPHISSDALTALQEYRWPGNVRELRNITEQLVVRRAGRLVVPGDLPREIVAHRPTASTTIAPLAALARDQILFDRMARGGEPFWTVVYDPFMARDLTREELRRIVEQGLEVTRGSYRSMVQLFNIPPTDYRRMLNFLRKHQCVLPFQQFRCSPIRVTFDNGRLPQPPACKAAG